MWWQKLGVVGNECIHNCSLFAIFLPKIIKIGRNLTKFWQKQICTVFWDTVYTRAERLQTRNETARTTPTVVRECWGLLQRVLPAIASSSALGLLGRQIARPVSRNRQRITLLVIMAICFQTKSFLLLICLSGKRLSYRLTSSRFSGCMCYGENHSMGSKERPGNDWKFY